jgi:hypothetical protein
MTFVISKNGVTHTDYTVISSTKPQAFSFIAMPGGNRTLLNYMQSFNVLPSSQNTGSGSWRSSFSGDLSYIASPIASISYFTTMNRVRVIDGDGGSDGGDWVIFNFGTTNGNGNFDGNRNTIPYFGGENSYSGGTGGKSVTVGYVWGFNSTSGWTLLYQLPLPGTSTYSHRNGNWLTSGGNYVTSGFGKRMEYDTLPITYLGFSVS